MWPTTMLLEAEKILNSLDSSDIIPAVKDVLNCFKINPYEIKVVILGQDPYPNPNLSNGYAFAIEKNQSIPPSLRQILKEAKASQGYLKTDETLKVWIHQGVWLLNTSLTISKTNRVSHFNFWHNLVKEVILFLNNLSLNIVWVLWGKHAQSFSPFIKGKIIKDAHPSPLASKHRQGHTFLELKKCTQIEF